MRIFLKDVPDDIFTALCVAKFDDGSDLKRQLQYKNGYGITNSRIAEMIKAEYLKFQSFALDESLYSRYEKFFNINFALVSRNDKKSINFQYKSDSWKDMIFLKEQHRKVKGKQNV